jgi:hypothetical protein
MKVSVFRITYNLYAFFLTLFKYKRRSTGDSRDNCPTPCLVKVSLLLLFPPMLIIIFVSAHILWTAFIRSCDDSLTLKYFPSFMHINFIKIKNICKPKMLRRKQNMQKLLGNLRQVILLHECKNHLHVIHLFKDESLVVKSQLCNHYNYHIFLNIPSTFL